MDKNKRNRPSGESLRRGANAFGEDNGIRFDRMHDGTYRQFHNGSPTGERFTEEQMLRAFPQAQGDPFYDAEQKTTKTAEPMDYGVHDPTDDTLLKPQEAFRAIICVDGEPYYASIQGRINDQVSP